MGRHSDRLPLLSGASDAVDLGSVMVNKAGRDVVVAFDRTGRFLVTGDGDGNVRCDDRTLKKEKGKVAVRGKVSSLAVADGNVRIVYGGSRGQLQSVDGTALDLTNP
jgi:hypothetical protein